MSSIIVWPKEMEHKPLFIYIAAPYTNGDMLGNIRRACFAGDAVLDKGHIPFVPHLFLLWDLISPKLWEKWLEIDFAILAKCDALLRLDGYSIGADREVAEAKRLGITVYYNIEEIE